MPRAKTPKQRHNKRKHATLAPSSLGNRDICAGYRSDKSDTYKAYSDEGTAMHEAAETGDVSSLNDDNELLKAINSGAFARRTSEQQHTVQVCLDYLAPLEATTAAAQVVVNKEIRLIVMPLWRVEFGTADRVIEWYEEDGSLHVHIVDFKFGKVPTSPAYKNAQGQAYAVGAWRKYPMAKRVTVHFLQPRVVEVPEPFTFFRTDLEALKFRVARIASRVVSYDAHPDGELLNPHFDNCSFCGRIGKCPAVANIAITQANAYSEAHDGEKINIGTIPSASMIDDPVMMARARAAATILDTWSKGVKRRAAEMWTEDNVDIPGFKLMHTEGSRQLDNALLVSEAIYSWNEAEPALAISEAELLSVCTGYNMEALDRLIKDKAARGDKSKALDRFLAYLTSADVLKLSGGGSQLRRDRSQPIP